jgi:murein hydrolase activator
MTTRRWRRAWVRTVALGLTVGLLPAAYGQTPAPQTPAERRRAEALAHRASDRMTALQREAENLASQSRTLLNELRQLEIERQMKAEELKQIEADLDATSARLADAVAIGEELRKTIREQAPAVESRLVELYKLGRPGYWRLLLGVDDLRSMGRAYRTVSAMAHLDRQRALQHQRNLEALEAARATLEAEAGQMQILREDVRQARAELERVAAARAERARAIDARRDLNAQLAGELQAAQQQLQGVLGTYGAGAGATPAVRLPIRPFRGDLPWPASGRVVSRFGRQHDARLGASVVRNGIEIATAEGAPVHAVHDGRVAHAEPFSGFGNLVIVDHGGQAYTLYGHLAFVNVKVGEDVDRQTAVGRAGRDPAGSPTLYFELRIDGTPVDPVEWLEPR